VICRVTGGENGHSVSYQYKQKSFSNNVHFLCPVLVDGWMRDVVWSAAQMGNIRPVDSATSVTTPVPSALMLVLLTVPAVIQVKIHSSS